MSVSGFRDSGKWRFKHLPGYCAILYVQRESSSNQLADQFSPTEPVGKWHLRNGRDVGDGMMAWHGGHG